MEVPKMHVRKFIFMLFFLVTALNAQAPDQDNSSLKSVKTTLAKKTTPKKKQAQHPRPYSITIEKVALTLGVHLMCCICAELIFGIPYFYVGVPSSLLYNSYDI